MSVSSEDDGKLHHPLETQSDDDDGDATFPYSSSDDDSDGQSPEDTQHPPLAFQHNFAPPFYGRPPTPLPPSPSLTSLLRPSRPTTPDASDDELEPVPRASPKVPTYEYYGFVLHLFSSLAFVTYLLWSYLPSPFLHALGIYYYPNRWWSLAVPSFLVMGIVYIYVALAAYNTEVLTLDLASLETVVDEAGKIAGVDWRKGAGRHRGRHGGGKAKGKGSGNGGVVGIGATSSPERRKGVSAREGAGRREKRNEAAMVETMDWGAVWNEGTDAVMDVPLAGVCEILYGEGRDGNGASGGDGDGGAVGLY